MVVPAGTTRLAELKVICDDPAVKSSIVRSSTRLYTIPAPNRTTVFGVFGNGFHATANRGLKLLLSSSTVSRSYLSPNPSVRFGLARQSSCAKIPE